MSIRAFISTFVYFADNVKTLLKLCIFAVKSPREKTNITREWPHKNKKTTNKSISRSFLTKFLLKNQNSVKFFSFENFSFISNAKKYEILLILNKNTIKANISNFSLFVFLSHFLHLRNQISKHKQKQI